MSWDGRWCGGSERLAGPGLFWGVPLHFAFILPLSRLVFSLRFTTFLVSCRARLVRGHLASLPQRFPESLLAVGAACDPACTKKGARATQVGGCASRCGEREKYATAPAARAPILHNLSTWCEEICQEVGYECSDFVCLFWDTSQYIEI